MAKERKGEGESAVEAEDVVELDAGEGGLEEAMQEALAAVAAAEGEEPAAAGVSELDRLARESAELREKWLRALADLENFRKRVQRERHEEQRYRGFEVFRELVGIVDDLGRAAASEGSAADLKQGVEMILRQLDRLLRDHGVERIEAAGRPFDPALHHAVSHHADAAVAEPTVAEELAPGYRMRDRLLRPAAVRVAMPAAEPQAPAEGEADGGGS